MSYQVLASSQNDKVSKIVRPTTTYQPSIWGERFLQYSISDQDFSYKKQRVDELKEVVRREVFLECYDNVSYVLKIVDDVQRLGLSYHFENEIEKALQHIYDNTIHQNHKDEDLHDTSTRFRLLRQHGFMVSSNIFKIFKDEQGNFKECLITDIPGLLSLYEASHLSYIGENILDEALAFTTTHLHQFVKNEKTHPLSNEVLLALQRPIRKSLERLHARHYISSYENKICHNKTLLELAKLDFNLLQCLHRKELSQISRWWKEIDFVHKLPFARDRIVELYLWLLGVFHEPELSLARIISTKVIALASVADDIYDAYGTFEELELLTESINRWDLNCADQLRPECLQTFYKVLLNCYEEFESELGKEESYKVYYAREAMKRLLGAYFSEARWLHEGYFPSFDEHLKVSLISCGYTMMIVTSLIGMKDCVTKQDFEWLSKDPKIMRDCNILCRFMDDIVSHKFEQQRDHSPSTVESYMRQYGVSEQEACDELRKQVINSWKEINKAFLRPSNVPYPVLSLVLNFSRVMDLLYKDGDGYTHIGKETKNSVVALLIDQIP
uniref:Beta-caryophyllene synthase TPS9FN n=1 Tax=Cannabis sativa TaxID=3483 RepID=TS9FN_CANSA